jgi:hypothetical protein
LKENREAKDKGKASDELRCTEHIDEQLTSEQTKINNERTRMMVVKG